LLSLQQDMLRYPTIRSGTGKDLPHELEKLRERLVWLESLDLEPMPR
jgi:hypothetical protein